MKDGHWLEVRTEQGKCIAKATVREEMPKRLVRVLVLLPITHSPPGVGTVGIEIPAKVKQPIGLDDAPSWVIVSEHNIDEWPNAGLSPIPGRPGTFR